MNNLDELTPPNQALPSTLLGSISMPHRATLAKVFRERRSEMTRALFDSVQDRTSASWERPQIFEEIEEWGRSQLETAVDLLAQWFDTNDLLFQELFEGWVRSRMVADLSRDGVPDDYKPDRVLQIAASQWRNILAPLCPQEAIAVLDGDLNSSIASLAIKPLKRLNILCIGDCIQYEAISALMSPCARDRIEVSATVLSEKVQPLLRNRIRSLPPDRFDLVFFSPFSHTYLPAYEYLLKPRSMFMSGAKVGAELEVILKEVRATLDTMVSHLECKIYVHNTAGTVLSLGRFHGLAKNLASWRNRAQARRIINAAITEHLNDPGVRADGRVQLIDENSLRNGTSALALGRVYFDSHAFHPTRLGVELGRKLYHEALYANAFLIAKKVIVCDLDNTLWDGVIGEGTVEHFLDRQQLLKELRRRGVLLAVNSKNDPKNIHWSGAILDAADFAASQINWEPKAKNMARLRDELNLKPKDFVFIDDRPDERERVQNAFPEMLVLDATIPATWKALAHWQKLLPENPEEDRTRLYHERVQREQFLKDQSQTGVAQEDEAAALRALEVTVRIREAQASDLKRAVELINRTNQFNLCGSRTTVRELQASLGGRHSVILADASDKYGSMGVVGVMLVEWKQGCVEVPIFVLSCRAFGFGIEYALLNSLRQLAPADHTIIGHFQETQWNDPCRKLYPASGMEWDGRAWVGKIAELPADPDWLAIHNQTVGNFPASDRRQRACSTAEGIEAGT